MVEAGARFVTLSWGGWDTHSNNFVTLKKQLGSLDIGLSALINDLKEAGRLDDTSICMWGEFGRTPKLNNKGGRDHWPNVSCAFLAGGGMRHGQVIGASDNHAAEPAERPVHMGEVHATLYQAMGIDPNETTLPDLTGRPQYLVDGWQPMKELV